LVTTPGHYAFYRSTGEAALQHTWLSLQAGASHEWLPLEAICYSGCLAENRLTMGPRPALNSNGTMHSPARSQPAVCARSFCQHIEMPGVWLERAYQRPATRCC
jgi:urease accessory protein